MLLLLKKFAKCTFVYQGDDYFIVRYKGKLIINQRVSVLSQDVDYELTPKLVFRITKFQSLRFCFNGVGGTCNISILEK